MNNNEKIIEENLPISEELVTEETNDSNDVAISETNPEEIYEDNLEDNSVENSEETQEESSKESQEVIDEEDLEENPKEDQPSEDSEEKEEVPNTEKKYYENYYLLYGEEEGKTGLDINGTLSFLNELGFDGGELRQARKGEHLSDIFKDDADSKNNKLYCSYCGAEISGVEFYRLPDGRARCTSCSNSLVKTKEEINTIYKRVIENLELFFGATINVPISIEVLEERKLKRKIGCSIGERDDKSILILGVAINKNKKYSILLENGAPRISLIATFAHELTHIWQYTHWDKVKGLKKCPPKKRLLIYEGMAKWVEIQYLYLIGEATVAKREEEMTRRRNDEYGIGFCIYEDNYPLSREAMTCENTPFTTDGYPID